MTILLTVVHVVVCFFLIVIVLLQHGKGADIGATFGGSGQTLFGTEGPLPLLNKITTAAAIIFMLTSITLAYISSHRTTGTVMTDIAPPPQEVVQPVEPEVDKTTPTIPLPEADAVDQGGQLAESPLKAESPAADQQPQQTGK